MSSEERYLDIAARVVNLLVCGYEHEQVGETQPAEDLLEMLERKEGLRVLKRHIEFVLDETTVRES